MRRPAVLMMILSLLLLATWCITSAAKASPLLADATQTAYEYHVDIEGDEALPAAAVTFIGTPAPRILNTDVAPFTPNILPTFLLQPPEAR
jgi:hypothetical protein